MIRAAKDVPTGGRKPSAPQLEGAVKLIEALAADWDPGDYEDRYRARLKKVVDRKKQGKRIKAPKAEKQPAPVDDLMAALERSLQDASGRRSRDGDRDDLERLSREELYERAQEAGVEGRSSMSKKELIDALG